MPDYIEGIINLRGNVIPVINLRKKFNLNEGQVTEESRIIVVDIHEQKIGILVDAVSRVAKVNEEEIEAYQEKTLNYKAKYVWGLAKKEDEILILLNPHILVGKFQMVIEA